MSGMRYGPILVCMIALFVLAPATMAAQEKGRAKVAAGRVAQAELTELRRKLDLSAARANLRVAEARLVKARLDQSRVSANVAAGRATPTQGSRASTRVTSAQAQVRLAQTRVSELLLPPKSTRTRTLSRGEAQEWRDRELTKLRTRLVAAEAELREKRSTAAELQMRAARGTARTDQAQKAVSAVTIASASVDSLRERINILLSYGPF
jgi:hypothetical protein